ncbi:hypothetical protein G6F42_018321 [Rhizopus arrhizus]|nr:hypothetical protein G6F42_018321 [Rhizopus arrhizus]
MNIDYLSNCVFVDESAFDINMRPSTARSAKGTPAIFTTPSTHAVSHTILGAISAMGVVNIEIGLHNLKPKRIRVDGSRKRKQPQPKKPASKENDLVRERNSSCNACPSNKSENYHYIMDQHEQFKDIYLIIWTMRPSIQPKILRGTSFSEVIGVYLPPYSSELNTIKQFWHVVKSKLKRERFLTTETLSTRIIVACNVLYSDLEGSARYSVKKLDGETNSSQKIMSLSQVSGWEENRKYGVIIDAGSSGSRVYIYSWKDHEFAKNSFTIEELKGKIPIVERGDKDGLKWTSREEPGISTFGSKPNEVGEHLDMLLDFSKEVVPEDSHASTPIFLMATAGMRLLPEDQQTELLSATCNYMREKTSFFISDCDSHVRIIPGELEGVYGWVAVNYLMGGFDSSIKAYTEKKDPDDQVEQHHTFGFLDMGGASAQIAFEPEHHQRQEHMHDLTRITLHTLDGRTVDYDVFVTTFLGYGSNEARRRYLEDRVKKLFATSNGKNLLDEHRMLQLDDPCLPLNLNLTDASSTSVALSLHGTGDFDKCIEYTVPLLNKDADCPTMPCLFNGVHTPDIDWRCL